MKIQVSKFGPGGIVDDAVSPVTLEVPEKDIPMAIKAISSTIVLAELPVGWGYEIIRVE